jgi:hypothetical protein
VGVIQRLRYKDANQRVAANRVLEVTCPQDQLAETIQQLFDGWNSASDAEYEASLATMGRVTRWAASNRSPTTRHYFLLAQPGHLLVTFGTSAKWFAERGLSSASHAWAGRITPVSGGDGDRTHIDVVLMRWCVDDGGRIWNGARYVELLDGLVAGLNGRYVSAPVDKQDYHFVAMA